MNRGLAENTAAFMPMQNVTRSGGPLAGLTILVVEDSQVSAEALRKICLISGARIRRANSMAATFRHLRTYRPDVLITEMNLPDGDGISLIRKLDAAAPRVPAIFGMSAFPNMQADAKLAGADGFIAKPVNCVAHFQHIIGSVLPLVLQQWKPSLISEERITVDGPMLIEDLAHGLEMLMISHQHQSLARAAAFIYGVAVMSEDIPLRDAAEAQLNPGSSNDADRRGIEVLRGMLKDRLRNSPLSVGLYCQHAAAGDRLM